MAQQPPPEAPQITAAKIMSASREKVAGISAQVTVQKTQADTDRDRAYVQAETQRTTNEHEATMSELAVRRELALLDYANKRNLSLDQIKAELAQTSMKLGVQKDLSLAGHIMDHHKHHNPVPQVITPPTEPAGRAPDGEAFQA